MIAALVVAFVMLAAAGAVARALAGATLNGPRFPLGTLVVNIAGSFALGLIAAWSAPASTLAGTAFLGAFTTFSSFARDVAALWEEGQRAQCVAYVVLTLGGSVTAAWAGLVFAGD